MCHADETCSHRETFRAAPKQSAPAAVTNLFNLPGPGMVRMVGSKLNLTVYGRRSRSRWKAAAAHCCMAVRRRVVSQLVILTYV